MYQTPDKCKQNLSAKLYLQSGEDYVCLSAFGSILFDIVQCSAVDVTRDALLNSAPFTLKNIVLHTELVLLLICIYHNNNISSYLMSQILY